MQYLFWSSVLGWSRLSDTLRGLRVPHHTCFSSLHFSQVLPELPCGPIPQQAFIKHLLYKEHWARSWGWGPICLKMNRSGHSLERLSERWGSQPPSSFQVSSPTGSNVHRHAEYSSWVRWVFGSTPAICRGRDSSQTDVEDRCPPPFWIWKQQEVGTKSCQRKLQHQVYWKSWLRSEA